MDFLKNAGKAALSLFCTAGKCVRFTFRAGKSLVSSLLDLPSKIGQFLGIIPRPPPSITVPAAGPLHPLAGPMVAGGGRFIIGDNQAPIIP